MNNYTTRGEAQGAGAKFQAKDAKAKKRRLLRIQLTQLAQTLHKGAGLLSLPNHYSFWTTDHGIRIKLGTVAPLSSPESRTTWLLPTNLSCITHSFGCSSCCSYFPGGHCPTRATLNFQTWKKALATRRCGLIPGT